MVRPIFLLIVCVLSAILTDLFVEPLNEFSIGNVHFIKENETTLRILTNETSPKDGYQESMREWFMNEARVLEFLKIINENTTIAKQNISKLVSKRRAFADEWDRFARKRMDVKHAELTPDGISLIPVFLRQSSSEDFVSPIIRLNESENKSNILLKKLRTNVPIFIEATNEGSDPASTKETVTVNITVETEPSSGKTSTAQILTTSAVTETEDETPSTDGMLPTQLYESSSLSTDVKSTSTGDTEDIATSELPTTTSSTNRRSSTKPLRKLDVSEVKISSTGQDVQKWHIVASIFLCAGTLVAVVAIITICYKTQNNRSKSYYNVRLSALNQNDG